MGQRKRLANPMIAERQQQLALDWHIDIGVSEYLDI